MADLVQGLFKEQPHKKGTSDKPKKDPLAETKKQKAFEKSVFKAEKDMQRQRKLEENHLQAEANRLEREWNPTSKRAQHEIREKAKHEAHAADGQMCEHGVWRCRICFPHKTGK